MPLGLRLNEQAGENQPPLLERGHHSNVTLGTTLTGRYGARR